MFEHWTGVRPFNLWTVSPELSQTWKWLNGTQVYFPFGVDGYVGLKSMCAFCLICWALILVFNILTWVYGGSDKPEDRTSTNRYQSASTLLVWIQLWTILVIFTRWTPLVQNLFTDIGVKKITVASAYAEVV